MNILEIRNQIISTKSWQEKSYLLNKVFIQGNRIFENTEFKNFSSWLDSFQPLAKTQGIMTGYSTPTLMSLRTTGGDYLWKMFGEDVRKEKRDAKAEGSKAKVDFLKKIKSCKVKSYKTLHMLIKKNEYTSEQKKMIMSGELERQHVETKGNVIPLINKLKQELKSNPDAMKQLEALEKSVA